MKLQMTVNYQKTARVVLLSQFRLYIDPNLMADEEFTTDLNLRPIYQFIKRLQEIYFPNKHPEKRQSGRIGVATAGNSDSDK